MTLIIRLRLRFIHLIITLILHSSPLFILSQLPADQAELLLSTRIPGITSDRSRRVYRLISGRLEAGEQDDELEDDQEDGDVFQRMSMAHWMPGSAL